MPRESREPLIIRVSIGFLLANGFLWAGFRNIDILLVSFISALLGLAGLVTGKLALRKIRHHGGRVRGESIATIGYWGNLLLFVLGLLIFAYAVAAGVYREEIL
jgi:hypothetical protein